MPEFTRGMNSEQDPPHILDVYRRISANLLVFEHAFGWKTEEYGQLEIDILTVKLTFTSSLHLQRLDGKCVREHDV